MTDWSPKRGGQREVRPGLAGWEAGACLVGLKNSVRGRRMGRQLVHGLLVSFPALLGVLFLCFCLLQVVPADPAMIIAGPEAKTETIAAIRQELGLDRPIPVQFADYLGRVLRGDLGRSIISNKMVSEELALTIGPT